MSRAGRPNRAREVCTAWALIAAASLTAGCTPTDRGVVSRADSAGVALVTNQLLPPDVPASADTVMLLGGAAEGPAGFFQVSRPLVDVDDLGRIYVLDRSRNQVVGFTPEGSLIRVWGHAGEGPGELSGPLSVSVTGQGEVVVHDASRLRFVRYARDGSLVGEEAASYTVIDIGLRHFEVVPNGIVFWDRDRSTPTRQARFDRLVSVLSGDTTLLVSGRPSQRSSAYHPRCDVTFSIQVPFSSRILWAQHGSRIVVSATAEHVYTVFDGEKLVQRVHIDDGAPAQLTRDEAASLLAAEGRRGPCDTSPSEVIDMYGFAPAAQAVRDIALAPNGDVWVLHVLTDRPRISVFDSTRVGRYTLPEAFPMPLAFLPDGRMLVSVADSLDVERLGIVAVVERSG